MTNNRYCYSRGNINAPIMIIGEAPGSEEISNSVAGKDLDQEVHNVEMPIPFCGPAGRLLHRLLYWVGLREGDMIFSNTTKIARFKPTGAVDTPTQTQVESEREGLVLEVVKIRPNLIISVGKIALWCLCYHGRMSMSALKMVENNGVMHEFGARLDGYPWVQIPVLPIIHPSALLRDPGDGRGYRTALRRALDEHKEMILNATNRSSTNSSNQQPNQSSPEANSGS